jgi:hypothetical protein
MNLVNYHCSEVTLIFILYLIDTTIKVSIIILKVTLTLHIQNTP